MKAAKPNSKVLTQVNFVIVTEEKMYQFPEVADERLIAKDPCDSRVIK